MKQNELHGVPSQKQLPAFRRTLLTDELSGSSAVVAVVQDKASVVY